MPFRTVDHSLGVKRAALWAIFRSARAQMACRTVQPEMKLGKWAPAAAYPNVSRAIHTRQHERAEPRTFASRITAMPPSLVSACEHATQTARSALMKMKDRRSAAAHAAHLAEKAAPRDDQASKTIGQRRSDRHSSSISRPSAVVPVTRNTGAIS